MNMLRRKLNDIFGKVQTGSSQIHLKRLQILYHESNFDEFLKQFLKCVNILIKLKNENDPYINKVLIFVSKFCTSLKKVTDDTELICPFLKQIFEHLFKEFNPDFISTYRVCQLINLLLKEIGEQEAFLDEDICIRIRDLMLMRIDDIKAKVRVQAIEVLQRLQEPLDNNDVIIKAFIERINDDNTQVRKCIVKCIGLNIISIPIVVGRCLDVSDEVRFESYDKISKIPIKALKIAQRQFVLRNGFADKCVKNKKFILKNLLPQWLSTYNGNYFDLICALKLDADEKDFIQTTKLVENVLRELFQDTEISTIMEALPLGKEKLIVSSEVQWEEIVFWRCLEQFLREQNTENDYVDKILPELIFFCDYVINVNKSKSKLKSDWDIVQHNHIMFELLKICHDYDYSEEVGRNALLDLITTILIDGPSLYDVIKILVKMLEKLIPDVDERTLKFCEIIAEIQTPMTPVAPSEDIVRKKNVKLAELRCKLNIAEDKQETAIEKEDYDKAAELKKEITLIKEKITELTKESEDQDVQRVPKTDTSTLCRCLDILTASLQVSQIRSFPENYRAFQDIFLPPLLHSRQPEVYWRSMRQLCLFSLYDVKLAKESMKVFFTPLIAHTFRPVFGDQTTIAAIKCVTDVILIHGAGVFDEEDTLLELSQRPTNKRKILDKTTIDEAICNEPLPSLELVIEILSELLDDTDEKIKETSGECLVTLILTGRVRSSLLFSKLLLKWFSPNTSKDVRLRQMIGQLVVNYVQENPYSLEVVEQAFVPTLQAIIDAPRNSPLADVDVDSVSKFLAALCGHKYNVGLDPHKNIALILCKEICERPQNKRTLFYLKALLYLEVPEDDEATLDILRKQVDVMQEVIKDKHCLRYVYKYQHKLENELTHNENTATTTSLTSAVPDSTVNTVDSCNTTAQTEKNAQADENDVSRYSSLSVKRRKRPGKENQAINGLAHLNSVKVRINRDLELEKQCSLIVMSETDSEYATESGLTALKKKHCSESHIPLVDKKDCTQGSSTTDIESVNSEQQKDLPSNITNKRLAVRLVRSKKIDKMCLKRTSREKGTKNKVLNVIIERNEEIERRLSKSNETSPVIPLKRTVGKTKINIEKSPTKPSTNTIISDKECENEKTNSSYSVSDSESSNSTIAVRKSGSPPKIIQNSLAKQYSIRKTGRLRKVNPKYIEQDSSEMKSPVRTRRKTKELINITLENNVPEPDRSRIRKSLITVVDLTDDDGSDTPKTHNNNRSRIRQLVEQNSEKIVKNLRNRSKSRVKKERVIISKLRTRALSSVGGIGTRSKNKN